MITVYVVWILDGTAMVTALPFDDNNYAQQAIQFFWNEDWVRMAYNEEFTIEEGFDPLEDQSYELVTVFIGENLWFIV